MPIVDLVLPKLGESIMEATILKWHKKVGDTIQLDETLLDIATDKVDSEIPSTAEGIITEILFEVNSIVPIGTVIAKIDSKKAAETPKVTSPSITTIPKAANSPVPVPPTTPTPAPKPVAIVEVKEEVPFAPSLVTNTISHHSTEQKFYSPLVISIAQSEGISMQELQEISGTGNQGRVSKKDIIAYIADKKAGKINPKNKAEQSTPTSLNNEQSIASKPIQIYNEPLPDFIQNAANQKLAHPEDVIISGNVEIEEMDRMRKLIAKHMVDSVHTSPHVTSFVEVDVTNMVVWRDKVKNLFEKREGTKLTFTPMFIEGIASALEQFPIINASIDGDKILYKKDINIGMATALPSGNLIVPVIKGANQLSIVGLTKAVNQLANAARNNQLKPSDTQNGTFTVTNVGTFGSIMGTPIISQPQVAVLALGAIKKRPVVVETPAGDAILIRHMMYLSMSYDHRIVDGAQGTRFLAAVAKNFEAWDINRQWFQYL
ncbi:MAG: 2-oxo acid dehydrogenase subunit E2 [Sediminibacterium sp.]|jgi:2-oxoglutarate dehydrogenase E2 component (dihydrolipoamide succinyltransferase)|nr:2-oxo acid dehydrogenase subunit E2 [Sediminibacterium sp.]